MSEGIQSALSAGPAAPASILIVEGYGHSREGLTTALRANGASIVTAAECLEALRKMKDGRFAVAIIDVDLTAGRHSDLTGWDLARIFRALHPSGAVILVTAEWRPDLRAQEHGLRDCKLIEKPIDPAELRGLVRSLHPHID